MTMRYNPNGSNAIVPAVTPASNAIVPQTQPSTQSLSNAIVPDQQSTPPSGIVPDTTPQNPTGFSKLVTGGVPQRSQNPDPFGIGIQKPSPQPRPYGPTGGDVHFGYGRVMRMGSLKFNTNHEDPLSSGSLLSDDPGTSSSPTKGLL